MKPGTALDAIKMVDMAAQFLVAAKVDDIQSALKKFQADYNRDPRRPPVWLSTLMPPITKEDKNSWTK